MAHSSTTNGDVSKEYDVARGQEISDLNFVLSTVVGRRFFKRILSLTGVDGVSFTGNNTTFYNEGRRSVGCELLFELKKANPDAYISMVKESFENEKPETDSPEVKNQES